MYRNYHLINEQKNIALVLALLSEPLDSSIFDGYPGMRVEEFQPMPRNLIHRIHEFGWHWIIKSFRDDTLRAIQVKHRMPQNDFDGQTLPITLEELEKRRFVFEGTDWIVFEVFQENPFPSTNPDRVDRTYYCAPASQICD